MSSQNSSNAARKTKLRWFQFSLSTIFLVITVAAVFLGLWTDRARKQRRAIEMILQRHGSFGYRYQTESNSSGQTPPGPAWLRNFMGIDYFDHVTTAGFTGDLFTDADLEQLQGLPNLETLVIGSSNVTDSGLKHLKYLQKLKHLELGGEKITDAGLVHLQHLNELTELELYCSITDAGMEHLTPLAKLGLLICGGYPGNLVKHEIFKTLQDPTDMEFFDTPLSQINIYLSDYHQIKFKIDKAALNDANETFIPITYTTHGIPLGVSLGPMLAPHGLDWLVGEDALIITTRDMVAKKHKGIEKLKKTLPNLKQAYVNW